MLTKERLRRRILLLQEKSPDACAASGLECNAGADSEANRVQPGAYLLTPSFQSQYAEQGNVTALIAGSTRNYLGKCADRQAIFAPRLAAHRAGAVQDWSESGGAKNCRWFPKMACRAQKPTKWVEREDEAGWSDRQCSFHASEAGAGDSEMRH